MVNLYQLYFSSSHFLSQPNKKVFHPSIFPPFQPNTNEGKLNFFYPPTFPPSHNFPPSHFFTPPSKHSLNDIRDAYKTKGYIKKKGSLSSVGLAKVGCWKACFGYGLPNLQDISLTI